MKRCLPLYINQKNEVLQFRLLMVLETIIVRMQTLVQLKENNQIIFTYASENPNGSR